MEQGEIANSEAQVMKYITDLRKKGRFVPDSVADLGMLPFQSFGELQAAMRDRTAEVRRFSVSPESWAFDAVASGHQRLLNRALITVTFLSPFVSVVLAFLYSWWWLTGILALFVGLSRGKKLYNRVVLNAASRSEVIFSFLYFTGQVCVTYADKVFYWDADEGNHGT